MTEIDVPDWVVKAAEDARVHRLNAVTAYGSAGVDERYHMAMRAALTAALGAWVVPAFFATGGEGDFTLFTEFTDIDQAYAHAGDAGWVVEAYALRQEKPNG